MNSIMHKLKYVNPPQGIRYNNPIMRKYLREHSDYSCAYCTITESESPGATFHIDHFKPRSKFPIFKDECINLRYCCPRCNLMKSDSWITEDEGCIRDCKNCHTKPCLKNMYRLIDAYCEDPNHFLVLGKDDILLPKNGSKPAIHTIKCLRLNRPQLIKLRKIRRILNLWKKELEDEKKYALEIIEKISSKKRYFNSINTQNVKQHEYIDILFRMLELQANFYSDFIDHELKNVNKLINLHSGGDDDFD
ncbi:MAG: HNH endonuclease [Sporolactobacillus sp.]